MKSFLPILLLLGGGYFLLGSGDGKTPLQKVSQKLQPIRVMVFESNAVSEPAYNATMKFFKSHPEYKYESLTASEIRNEGLDDFDVVIFQGGSGGGQAKDLGEKGREIVQNFVKNGGGYIGICAGAYMALQQKEGSDTPKLAIVAGQSYGEGWQRGMGPARIQTNDGEIELFYANGPLFEERSVSGISPFKVLGTYLDDYFIPSKKTYEGEMPGKPALIVSNYRKGRVLLFSPNPVLGPGVVKNEKMFDEAIQWVAEKGKISSNIKFSHIFS